MGWSVSNQVDDQGWCHRIPASLQGRKIDAGLLTPELCASQNFCVTMSNPMPKAKAPKNTVPTLLLGQGENVRERKEEREQVSGLVLSGGGSSSSSDGL